MGFSAILRIHFIIGNPRLGSDLFGDLPLKFKKFIVFGPASGLKLGSKGDVPLPGKPVEFVAVIWQDNFEVARERSAKLLRARAQGFDPLRFYQCAIASFLTTPVH